MAFADFYPSEFNKQLIAGSNYGFRLMDHVYNISTSSSNISKTRVFQYSLPRQTCVDAGLTEITGSALILFSGTLENTKYASTWGTTRLTLKVGDSNYSQSGSRITGSAWNIMRGVNAFTFCIWDWNALFPGLDLSSNTSFWASQLAASYYCTDNSDKHKLYVRIAWIPNGGNSHLWIPLIEEDDTHVE